MSFWHSTVLLADPLQQPAHLFPTTSAPEKLLKPKISSIEVQLSSSHRHHSMIGLCVYYGTGTAKVQWGIFNQECYLLSLTGLIDLRKVFGRIWRCSLYEIISPQINIEGERKLFLSYFAAVQVKAEVEHQINRCSKTFLVSFLQWHNFIWSQLEIWTCALKNNSSKAGSQLLMLLEWVSSSLFFNLPYELLCWLTLHVNHEYYAASLKSFLVGSIL